MGEPDPIVPRGPSSDDGSAARRLTVTAPAKLTLSLRMTGRRTDGYHLLDAEMVSLELADTLELEPRPQGSIDVVVTGPYAAGVPTGRDNLVWRALELAFPGAPHSARVVKRIPPGGGLGGGSTDAAAVLRAAGWGNDPDQLAAASRLGADIPFCIVGGRARVRGIGEVIEPLPALDHELDITLVMPPLEVSTPAAYRAFDALPPSPGRPPGPNAEAWADVSGFRFVNDLETAALEVEPQLGWWRQAIAERVGGPPTLAGSGATWFIVGRHDNALADLVDEGAVVVTTRTRTRPGA